jgi:hypothetical protein
VLEALALVPVDRALLMAAGAAARLAGLRTVAPG